MALLENWRIVSECLLGNVYDHSEYRNGAPIQTSRLLSIVPPKWVCTQNAIYELGKPHPLFVSLASERGQSVQEAIEDLASAVEKRILGLG